MTAPSSTWPARILQPISQTASKLAQVFFAITHNSMALLGLALAITVAVFASRPDLRQATEEHVYGWLLQRQSLSADIPVEPSAIERVTAVNPSELPRTQAQVATWLSRKYRVAQEPVSALVAEAYLMGQKARLDPTLILAVMAIESGFNPYAASPVGAQGLMQVMTRVHTDKYDGFGGSLAAFDPVSNLRVGVQVLKDTIRQAGSVDGGLRLYVGAVTTNGQNYVDKVLSEHERLRRVAQGQKVAFNAYQRVTQPSNAPPSEASALPPPVELEAGAPAHTQTAQASAS